MNSSETNEQTTVDYDRLRVAARELRQAKREVFKSEFLLEATDNLDKKLRVKKLQLQENILNSDSFFKELIEDTPDLADIFGTLNREETFTYCLGWLLKKVRKGNFIRHFLECINQTDEEKQAGEVLSVPPESVSDWRVRREYGIEVGRADLIIHSENNDFILLLENKILEGTKEGVDEIEEDDKKETINQLEKYQEWLKSEQNARYDSKILFFLCLYPEQMKTDYEQLEKKSVNFNWMTWEQLAVRLRRNQEEIEFESQKSKMIFDMFLSNVIRTTSPLTDYEEDLKKLYQTKGSERIPKVPLTRLKTMKKKIEGTD